MEKPIVSKSIEQLWNPKDDSYQALQRIVKNEYLADSWEDDPNDSVRQLYRFLLNDIEKPRGKSLVEDKCSVISLMLEDVLNYRKAFLGDKYKVHLNPEEKH